MLTSASQISNNGSISNDSGSTYDRDYAADSATGSIFHADYKKHDDLKEMLDSNKDNLKLEAMKRIIGMVAKGRDGSMLFPSVVKNVVSKNIEVKKLVYVYLERYAEEQQDLALLSISTFQRALKEPNQLIRAGALRVLSSIRVKMISPIVMLAIRDASADMSPYVRKTAAHAIPKLYSLDNDLKEELVTVIKKLLADKTVLVIGSAVMAFTIVCPERLDLIHQVYRKLCALLIDVDEWGQVTIINMLTRYGREQFADPNIHEDKPNVLNDSDENSDSDRESPARSAPSLDPDHRMLLRSTKPLLQSRNAAVVMAVAQLYLHVAPRSEWPIAAKALIRLLWSHVEVQSVVLNSICSISAQNRTLFEPYLKSFFIRISDPTKIKLLKLDILTNLATDNNVAVILREFQTYISHSDKKFVAATIQAIGKCACSISTVTDTCLNGLVSLLSKRDEAIVAESVVVVKKLLQTQAADSKEIITHMTKLLETITVPQARAAIVWLLGEHVHSVYAIAPDVLRKLTKTFSDEDDIVKFQLMNLAVKLHLNNPKQTALLCDYIFNLAKYDQNYDIRDKVRFLRIFLKQNTGILAQNSKRIFLANKPAPLRQSQSKDHKDLQLGSLSHYVKQRVAGYEPLPLFPENPPPGHVREVEPLVNTTNKKNPTSAKDVSWKSESSSADSSEESGTTSESDGSSTSASDTSSEEEEDSSDSSSSSEDSANAEEIVEKEPTEVQVQPIPESNLQLLLDMDDFQTSAPVLTPMSGIFLAPITPVTNSGGFRVIPSLFTNTKIFELLNKVNGKGLSATYRFTRTPHIVSAHMTNINIVFNNNTNEEINDIRLGKKTLGADMAINDFTNIVQLPPNSSTSTSIGIDFNDTIQSATFEIECSTGHFSASIHPTIGELLQPIQLSAAVFDEKQSRLKGMYEHIGHVKCTNNVCDKLLQIANVGICDISEPENHLKFAGQTWKSSYLLLISIINGGETVKVNCESMLFGSIMLNELLQHLKS